MEKFVLMANRRTGTSLMIDCLNSHPRIHCTKRAFGVEKRFANPDENHQSGGYFLYRTGSLKRRLRHVFAPGGLIAEFLDREIFVQAQPGTDVIGFRLLYEKVRRHPQLLDLMRSRNMKVIHLVRENILKTYISTITAPLHKMYHPREGAEIRTVSIEVDIPRMLRELDRRERLVEEMRRAVDGLPVLEISYESFVRDRDAEAARILPHLGLDVDTPLVSDLVKINPSSMRDVILNYDAVAAALSGTRHAVHLD